MIDIAHSSSGDSPYETARSGAPCALFPGLEPVLEIKFDKLPRGVFLIPSCARVLGAISSPQAPAEPHRRSGAALRREPPEASPLNRLRFHASRTGKPLRVPSEGEPRTDRQQRSILRAAAGEGEADSSTAKATPKATPGLYSSGIAP